MLVFSLAVLLQIEPICAKVMPRMVDLDLANCPTLAVFQKHVLKAVVATETLTRNPATSLGDVNQFVVDCDMTDPQHRRANCSSCSTW